MEEKLHTELIEKIEELKGLVKRFSTSSLLNTVAMELRKHSFPDQENSRLVSPAKQCFYLMGIMQQTEEPCEPQTLDEKSTSKLIDSLNEVFQLYALIFWPSEEEKDDLSEEWHRCREVAMPAFLHYFNTSLMASVEQVANRINEGLLRFDQDITDHIGLSISSCLDICNLIAKLQQNKLDQLYLDAEKEKELRLGLLDAAASEGWSEQRLKEETAKSEYSSFIPRFLEHMNNLFSFKTDELDHSQEEIEKFLTYFSLKRGAGIEFTYITEENPAESRPIIESNDSNYFCPSINALFTSLLNQLETIVLNSEKRDRFLHHRDMLLEKSGEGLFLDLLKEEAIAYSGLYETANLHHEHDSIIVSGRNLFLVEAKASPPIEPFRDPEKSYTRIKRHFRSNRGIQKGFEQAERIRGQLAKGSEVSLYDGDSNLVLTLNPDDFDNVFSICLTRDDYGPLATNLNLLLEKSAEAPYPWVINQFDLESLVQGYKHLELKEEHLVTYLNERIQLHGKLFGTDELEYVGFGLKHGGLKDVIEKDADLIFLSPDYSDIFDEIYLSEKSGEKVKIDVTRPILMDAREGIFGRKNNSKKNISTKSKNSKRKNKNKIAKQSRKKNRRKK
ncbi:hypothetical protein [Candidatus Thalassolituus haligoni]|uniref:hypothetical protein n=1 Tax=Candidatus Thalassolituus haligoni TaxID=3100113 RepID=UPI0035164B34